MILAGDIGGTKTNIALFQHEGKARPVLVREQSFRSRDHDGLQPIIAEFLKSVGNSTTSIQGACFGVAGPIVGRRSQIPNLTWTIDADSLQKSCSLPHLSLINDLEATAEGILALNDDELATLNPGKPSPAGSPLQPGAVIAAGTGLGMALLQPIGDEWIPAASEGGHMDFAPRNSSEVELLRFLHSRHKRVSVERVVSGPGLHSVYDFLCQGAGSSPNAELARQISADAAAAPGLISDAALAQRCPTCIEALQLFVAAYGACAGNLGLLALSSGGLFLGGGIAPKILPKLKDGTFMAAFADKGRLSPVLESMPVRVILNQQTALLGAARRALRNAGPVRGV